MKDFLQRYSVGKRMFASFSILLVLMATIAIVANLSLANLKDHLDQIVQVRVSKTRLANTLYDNANQIYMDMQALMISDDAAEQAAILESIKNTRQVFDDTYAELDKLPGNAQDKAVVQAIHTARNIAVPLNQQVIEKTIAGEHAAAREVLKDKAIAGLQAWRDAATAAIGHETRLTAQAQAQADSASSKARTTLWLALAVAVLIGAILAWQITASLTVPLARAAAAARELAAGRLDGAVLTGGKDEAGEVLRAIQGTRESLQQLISGIHEMGRQHDAGNVSFRPDASGLEGEYLTINQLLDAQISEHIAAALTAGRLASRYALGDLSEDFPRMPGEKATLMHAMDGVKAAISRISEEILQLSGAAVRGDFSVRGHQDDFQYGFRDMLVNLNQLMATADGSLGELSQVLRSIAAGDLTVRMDGNYQGVFAAMRDDANATVSNLTGIVGRIQQAAANINTAADEIATGNTDLSARTEQQAANLEETAASMEELTSTVRQNAESSRQAEQLATGAAQVASNGGEVVSDAVRTMGAIEQSSRRIADIISVIDGIAFQTNILALNAAVEAARAGEQGRGFAVVASEVRTLAQRSAAAAKEIKDLIDDSVNKVTTGSAQVRKAGDTMVEIVTSVQRVNGMIAEISAASQEQSSGIEQVNHTVIQMDETTQQNAALVEEASAAARAMADQAAELSHAVSVFKLAS